MLYNEQKIRKDINWLISQIKCLKEKACECEGENSIDQNNKVVVLSISESELSGTGTLEEQIAQWFNTYGPILVDDKTNLVIEIIESEEPIVIGKSFQVDTNVIKYCAIPPQDNFNLVLYHQGINDKPTAGDTIYSDEACTILFISNLSSDLSQSCEAFMYGIYKTIPFRTDNDGKLIELFCD